MNHRSDVLTRRQEKLAAVLEIAQRVHQNAYDWHHKLPCAKLDEGPNCWGMHESVGLFAMYLEDGDEERAMDQGEDLYFFLQRNLKLLLRYVPRSHTAAKQLALLVERLAAVLPAHIAAGKTA